MNLKPWRKLVLYDLGRCKYIWHIGIAVCIALPIAFQFFFGNAVARESVSLVWLAWIVFMFAFPLMAALVGAEVYGRDVAEGNALFFCTLPVSRSMRLTAKLTACLLVLSSWALLHIAIGMFLVLSRGMPAQWNPEEIRLLTLALYLGGLFWTLTSAVLAESSGSSVIAFLLGGVLTAGVYGFVYDAALEWQVMVYGVLGLCMGAIPFLLPDRVDCANPG